MRCFTGNTAFCTPEYGRWLSMLFIAFIFFFAYGVGLDVVLCVHFCFHRTVVIHEYCLEENRVGAFISISASHPAAVWGSLHATAILLQPPLRDSPFPESRTQRDFDLRKSKSIVCARCPYWNQSFCHVLD